MRGMRGAVVVMALLASGCTQAGGVFPLFTGGASNTPVTFSVTLNAQAFSDKRQISVRVYDSEQLAIAEQTGNCTVSYDAQTRQEKVQCPPGVTYRQAAPEEWTVTRADLARGLTLDSKTVTVGERYRISISGMAADDCNTAGATAEGRAGSASVRLENMEVSQTLMACEPTRN